MVKGFLERLVNEFDISETGTHIALIGYSTTASVVLKFNDLVEGKLNAVNVKRYIQNVPHTRGFTYIDKALNLADKEVFNEKNGMRKDVSQVNLFLLIFVSKGPFRPRQAIFNIC